MTTTLLRVTGYLKERDFLLAQKKADNRNMSLSALIGQCLRELPLKKKK